MQILALEKELKPLNASTDSELLRQEAAAVWELQKAEVIREIWFTRPERTAVLLLETETLEEAREVLGGLPLVREGKIEFDLRELAPYDGFERLFRRS